RKGRRHTQDHQSNATPVYALTRRGEVCLVCDTSKKLVCPENCPEGTQCLFITPKTCRDSCPRAICQPIDELTDGARAGVATRFGGNEQALRPLWTIFGADELLRSVANQANLSSPCQSIHWSCVRLMILRVATSFP